MNSISLTEFSLVNKSDGIDSFEKLAYCAARRTCSADFTSTLQNYYIPPYNWTVQWQTFNVAGVLERQMSKMRLIMDQWLYSIKSYILAKKDPVDYCVLNQSPWTAFSTIQDYYLLARTDVNNDYLWPTRDWAVGYFCFLSTGPLPPLPHTGGMLCT